MEAEIAGAGRAGKKVIPIVPYSVTGRYRTSKTFILTLAYLVYFLLPWLRWHGDARSGQAILFDLANARFYLFDLVLFPHDLIILTGVMVFAATLLFAAATLYGRIFCGFFCFQTLWTDAFRFIEKFIQGEAQARIRLHKQPWNLEKLCKLGATHALWLLLSFATALTFTLYFSDAHGLIASLFSGQATIAAYTTIVVLTGTTYVAAGLAREQICLVACPYGKFQSVMQDAATLTVVYDAQRGERSRGRIAPSKALKHAGTRQSQGYGDCIDCGYCVNVCPTGVDIRKGFQIDCISCGLCVDACNNIMDSVDLARGLIRFDQMPQQGREAAAMTGSTWPGLKKAGYVSLLALSAGFVVYSASTLAPFNAVVQQQAQPLVIRLANGELKSRYTVRITNKSPQRETYIISARGLPAHALNGNRQFAIPAGKTYSNSFNVQLNASAAKRIRHFTIIIVPKNNPAAQKAFPLSYFSTI